MRLHRVVEPCQLCGCQRDEHQRMEARLSQCLAILGVLDLTCSNEVWKSSQGTACGVCPECVALKLLEGP